MPDGSPSNVEDQKVAAAVENDSRRPLAVASPAPQEMGNRWKLRKANHPWRYFVLMFFF